LKLFKTKSVMRIFCFCLPVLILKFPFFLSYANHHRLCVIQTNLFYYLSNKKNYYSYNIDLLVYFLSFLFRFNWLFILNIMGSVGSTNSAWSVPYYGIAFIYVLSYQTFSEFHFCDCFVKEWNNEKNLCSNHHTN